MAQHRSSRSPSEVTTNARHRWVDPEVTDIIPFNEFGSLNDLDFLDNSAFDTESQVLRAPELDDLSDTDNLTPLRLAVPSEFRADPAERPRVVNGSGGAHRKEPASAGVVKGRLLIAAMATGAAAAAAHTAVHAAQSHPGQAVLAADESALGGAAIEKTNSGVELVTVRPSADVAVHSEELANAQAFAQERADRDARLQRPLFVMPTHGIYTSGFGYRWGVLHGGIDIANSIGTPILAASDGVVTDAGPAAGFGLWVKVRHPDGTVTVYGHVNTITCSVGQRVMAGDQIATMGNRGNSTGPHLHFEVLLNGTNRTDPVPWLAQRGLSPGTLTG
ncbi:MAG: M23 family metallopeptidase [Mycobacteriaceae bacterium]|nr:M23 family metallopeptidase [Mycobacteriaceae bacterium]